MVSRVNFQAKKNPGLVTRVLPVGSFVSFPYCKGSFK